MFYIKPSHKAISKGRLCAFSLMEVMLTVAIVAILIIILAPLVTKKTNAGTKTDGIVYVYDKNTESLADAANKDKCLITLTKYKDEDGRRLADEEVEREYLPSIECSEYEFTVPERVNQVDITLVAGGGGGGGAAGGTIEEIDINDDTNYWSLNGAYTEEIRGFKIEKLIGAGETVYTSSSSVIRDMQEIRGGASSSAIIDYEIPRELISPFDDHRNPIAKNQDVRITASLGSASKNGSANLVFQNPPAGAVTSTTMQQGMYLAYRISHPTANDLEGFICCNTDPNSNEDSGFVNRCSQAGLSLSTYNVSEQPYIGRINVPTSYNPIGQTCYNKLDKKSFLASVMGERFLWDGTKGIFTGGTGGALVSQGAYGKGMDSPELMCYTSSENGVRLQWQTRQSGAGSSSRTQNPNIECDLRSSTFSNPGIIRAFLSVERPGGVGGGGAGGTVVKLNSFPVTPGDTYIVRVGRGGEQGAAGVQGVSRYNYYAYTPKAGDPNLGPHRETLATQGNDGKGGTSSSIWHVTNGEEQLVALVTGGAGGEGGQRYKSIFDVNKGEAVSFYNTGKTADDYTHTPYAKNNDENTANGAEWTPNDVKKLFHYQYDKGRAGSHAATVLYNESRNIIMFFDPDYVSSNGDVSLSDDKAKFHTAGNIRGAYVAYKKFINNAQNKNFSPEYSYLNSNAELYLRDGSADHVGTENRNLFGYDNFKFTPEGYNDYDEDDTNITFDGLGFEFLTPFYYRTIVNNNIGYVGGLGGFTGFGGKAGCGGLFIGSPNGFDGKHSDSPLYNKKYNENDYIADGTRRIVLPKQYSTANRPEKFVLYDVADYYDNCKSNTPNGQTADFVMPNPKRQTFGQAGSGGGGGGYTMFVGAGDGGAGQNGYVMINWRTHR